MVLLNTRLNVRGVWREDWVSRAWSGLARINNTCRREGFLEDGSTAVTMGLVGRERGRHGGSCCRGGTAVTTVCCCDSTESTAVWSVLFLL
jgi:hypothetical protein